MPTPDELERRFTPLTAAARYDALRMREALASPTGEEQRRILARRLYRVGRHWSFSPWARS